MVPAFWIVLRCASSPEPLRFLFRVEAEEHKGNRKTERIEPPGGESMHYRICLDGDPEGPWMGHALEEPGCIWLAPSREEVVSRAPEAISQFLAWLRTHGEPDARPTEPKAIRVEVAAIQEIAQFGQSGSAVGLFEWDLLPATDVVIATAVRRLGYARRELLETVAELPAGALDWRPPGNKRTVRENLVHVRNCHGFYLTRILGWDGVKAVLPEPWPEDLFFSLNWVMVRSVAALLDLPPSLRNGIYRADRPSEDWTARKMLRRFVEHELEHVDVVRRTVWAYRESVER